jgi:hypothetical protein
MSPPPERSFWRSLVHTWFVEYNPLYLLSAMLVLGGCFLLSRGLATEEGFVESLGIALVSELYAFALIGGAALLTRIGLRRPAVMLALLVTLYQWDLTLHTETCAYLGAPGAWATAAWLALFVGKLYALGWALRVRLARRAVAAATVAAIGLALGPRLVPSLGAHGAGAALAVWMFALGALYEPGAIASEVDLGPWGRVVLARATRAAWLLSFLLVLVHVGVWWRDHAIALSTALPVVPLLFLLRARSEARTWAFALGTLVAVGAVLPGAFAVTALLAAAALCLRALWPSFPLAPATPDPIREQPYRSGGAWAPEAPAALEPAVLGPHERARAFVGALFALYLAAWTFRWSGGPWPAHVLALDLALTAAVLLFAWRTRTRSSLAPLALAHAHHVVVAGLVPAPKTSAQWGATAVALGFVLLGACLATSYRLGRKADSS